ncbi:MAG: o-succinylbenzoate synthase, partial [Myxococcota bacterium]
MNLRWQTHAKRLTFPRPLVTAHGEVAHREVWILVAEDNEGRQGCGELCPWPGFGSNDPMAAAAELERLLLPSEMPDSVAAIDTMVRNSGLGPELRAAIELATLDLLGAQTGVPVARLLADEPRDSVPIHHLVNDAADTPLLAHAVKMKVGAHLEDDLERVRAVRARLGADVPIRLDANGAWSVDEARTAIDRFAPLDIEFIEQPVAGGAAALAPLRGSIPIAADESIVDDASLEALLEARAVDVVVLKPAFLGGLLATQRLASRAKAAGIDVVITHALGSAVERTGALHLAAALPTTRACGLAHPFREDLAELYTIASGLAHLGDEPGLGL